MNAKSFLEFIVVVVCLNVTPALSQTYVPLEKPGLLQSLSVAKKKGWLNNEQFIQSVVEEIERNGVKFQLGKKEEVELRKAGAHERIIDAARNHYRPLPKAKPTPVPTPAPRILPPKTGEPFNLDEILTWLQKGASSSDLKGAVEARFVDFILEEVDESRITNLGGKEELIATIKKSAKAEAIAAYYEQIIQIAERHVVTNQWPEAEKLLIKAIELAPSKPDAFRLRGEVNLYKVTLNKTQQYANAKSDLLEALRLGGTVSFRVSYNKGGKDPYCPGRLLVKKESFIFNGSCSPGWDPIPDLAVKSIDFGTENNWVKADKGGFTIVTSILGKDKKPLRFGFQAYGMAMQEVDLIRQIILNY